MPKNKENYRTGEGQTSAFSVGIGFIKLHNHIDIYIIETGLIAVIQWDICGLQLNNDY